MRGLPQIKLICSLLIVLFFNNIGHAQEATSIIEQDPQIRTILKERKRLLVEGELKAHYSIQVFSGEITNARGIIKECKSIFSEYKSEIVYETPNYKVQIGEFRNQIDADRALLKISEKHPGAFILRPNK